MLLPSIQFLELSHTHPPTCCSLSEDNKRCNGNWIMKSKHGWLVLILNVTQCSALIIIAFCSPNNVNGVFKLNFFLLKMKYIYIYLYFAQQVIEISQSCHAIESQSYWTDVTQQVSLECENGRVINETTWNKNNLIMLSLSSHKTSKLLSGFQTPLSFALCN